MNIRNFDKVENQFPASQDRLKARLDVMKLSSLKQHKIIDVYDYVKPNQDLDPMRMTFNFAPHQVEKPKYHEPASP
jgi:hypothetical protein